eukprot:545651-Prymnesium_polylepis.1
MARLASPSPAPMAESGIAAAAAEALPPRLATPAGWRRRATALQALRRHPLRRGTPQTPALRRASRSAWAPARPGRCAWPPERGCECRPTSR